MLMPKKYGDNLFDEFDHWMEPPFDRDFFGGPNHSNIMRTDIKEKDDCYELAVDLPGFKKSDVNVQLKEGYLTITATQDINNEEKRDEGKYIRKERYTGSARRSFYLGEDIRQEDIHAKFEDGILKLSITKKDAKPLNQPSFIDIEG